MDTQKAENLLNLSVDATEEEREKSVDLGVGFNPLRKTWELIVRYNGSLSFLEEEFEGVTVVELANAYAILTVPQELLEQVIALPQIEYVEKPKRLFFALATGKTASCIPPVQTPQWNLLGQGVIVAVLDSGIDYSHPDFRNADGTTRIRNLWDQTIAGSPPSGYRIGTEYTKEQIDEALAAPARERYSIVPSRDLSGHGTAVAGVCCGGGMEERRYRGVAPESDIIVVKLGNPMEDSFPKTTELMQAVDYVVKKGLEYQKPVAINISFGNTYGSHDGTSLLETFIDDISGYGRNAIAVGTGNEGGAAGHVQGKFIGMEPSVTELSVGPYETGFSVQLWKYYADIFDIELTGPGGRRVGPIQKVQGPQRFTLEGTEILLYYGEPSPYSTNQEIYMDFLPGRDYVTQGIWQFRLVPRKLVVGTYDMWLPSAAVLNPSTRFLRPTPETSLTIPSTAAKVISVGAYDVSNQSYAAFSGRGYTWNTNLVKPDLVAPGVGIMTARAGGGYGPMTGTSFATPFVTGGAALLMQWGIVNGNDPYLYGEKVKAYLIRGARQFPVFEIFPNPQVGYGSLCVRDSIPV